MFDIQTGQKIFCFFFCERFTCKLMLERGRKEKYHEKLEMSSLPHTLIGQVDEPMGSEDEQVRGRGKKGDQM